MLKVLIFVFTIFITNTSYAMLACGPSITQFVVYLITLLIPLVAIFSLFITNRKKVTTPKEHKDLNKLHRKIATVSVILFILMCTYIYFYATPEYWVTCSTGLNDKLDF